MCVLLPILRFKPRYGLRRQPNVQADLCSNRRFRCSARRCVTCGTRASDNCGAKPGVPGIRRAARSPVAGPRLSAREIDVLRVISRGASNKEAAQELTMSLSTVPTHVEKVFRKFECSTRAAATLKASSLGLI